MGIEVNGLSEPFFRCNGVFQLQLDNGQVEDYLCRWLASLRNVRSEVRGE
jgi:hypothetical protein